MATFVVVTSRSSPDRDLVINLDRITQIASIAEGHARIVFDDSVVDVTETFDEILHRAGLTERPAGRWVDRP